MFVLPYIHCSLWYAHPSLLSLLAISGCMDKFAAQMLPRYLNSLTNSKSWPLSSTLRSARGSSELGLTAMTFVCFILICMPQLVNVLSIIFEAYCSASSESATKAMSSGYIKIQLKFLAVGLRHSLKLPSIS